MAKRKRKSKRKEESCEACRKKTVLLVNGLCEKCFEKRAGKAPAGPSDAAAAGVIREVSAREGKLQRIEELAGRLAAERIEVAKLREMMDAAKGSYDAAKEDYDRSVDVAEGIEAQIVEVAETDAEKVDDLPLFAPRPDTSGSWQGVDDPRGDVPIAQALGKFGKRADGALEAAAIRTVRDLVRHKTQHSGAVMVKGIGEAAGTKIESALADFIIGFGVPGEQDRDDFAPEVTEEGEEGDEAAESAEGSEGE